MYNTIIRAALTGFCVVFITSAILSDSAADSGIPRKPAALTDDFRPATGSGQPMPVGGYRLLFATSTDGLSWTKTNLVLGDRSSVADGLVLTSGRILMYYVTVSKIVNGSEQMANDIVVAVSDDNGISWTYKNVTFSGEIQGGTKPVDPNVVLLDNGSIRMFMTIDPDMGGSQHPQTYSAISTDGGFTFAIEGKRFSVDNSDLLDPENYRFSDTNWRIWSGGTPGTSRLGVSTDGGTVFSDQGAFATVTDDSGRDSFIVADVARVSESLYRMYMFGKIGSSDGIKSMYSSDGITWTVDSGNRLTGDASRGTETSRVWAPTVVRRSDGTFLMVYETEIPTGASSSYSSIRASATGTSLKKGETTTAYARTVCADSTLRDITRIATWTSSNTSVATVSSYGTVTAVSSGTATITATYGSLSGSVTITVEPEPFKPPVIITTSLRASLQNAAYADTVRATDADTGDTVTFSMLSGPSWLTVSASGILSGTPGNADIGTHGVVIRALDSHNLADTLSTTISVANILDPPSDLRASDTPNDNGHSITLTWKLSPDDASGYVTGYRIYRSRMDTLTEPVPLSRFATVDSLVFWESRATVLIDSVTTGISTYIDVSVPLNGVQYHYWIQAFGNGGSSAKIAAGTPLAVNGPAPESFSIGDAHPNPFNPSTSLEYTLPRSSHVTLSVYTVTGQRVAIIIDRIMSAGVHTVAWNASGFPSGVYFFTFQADGFKATRKVMLLK